MSTRSIHEVLEYGPIVANDEELDILITVNGAYYNIWCGNGEGFYNNTDVRALNSGGQGLYGMDIVKVMDKAKEILEEITKGDDNERDND